MRYTNLQSYFGVYQGLYPKPTGNTNLWIPLNPIPDVRYNLTMEKRIPDIYI